MKVFRAQPFAVRPNSRQEQALNRLAGARRKAWNTALEQGRRKVEEISLPSWFSELPRGLAKFALTDLVRSAHPKFLSKQFTRGHFRLGRSEVTIKGRTLQVPSIGLAVRMRGYRPVAGNIMSVAFTATPSGWDGSVLTMAEVPEPAYDPDIEFVGIDVGLKTLATLSDGTTVERPAFNKPDQEKAQRIRNVLDRMVKGSKNHIRLSERLARIYLRMRNRRTNFIHQTSRKIVDSCAGIAVETLDITQMIQSKPWLRNSLVQAALGRLLFQISYKCVDAGKPCVQVGRWFPSSKTCNRCGEIKRKLGLEDRRWDCPRCKSSIDRDLNAALNIRDEGMRIYHETTRRDPPCKAPARGKS